MPAVNRSDSWAWSITLLITCLLGVGLGLSLGYALFRDGAAPEIASAPDAPSSAAAPLEQAAPQDQGSQAIDAAVADSGGTDSVAAVATGLEQRSGVPTEASDAFGPGDADIGAARHLFIAVNGQWLAEGTKAFLRELKPGGVILRTANLRSESQTLELVKEIKRAAGSGDGLGDLPLIAVQEEGGPNNRLGLADSPSAQDLGRSGDDGRARSLGLSYAQACLARGIGVTLSPVLDVYESGTVDPGLEIRSFGTDQAIVANIGLAMVDGMRQGGIIPVVKHFPGYGASTYGTDGTLVVLNKDVNGLARVMYPFSEAVRRNVQGMVVGYVAVPALNKEDPRRPAALSSILVTDLLRNRWGFEGVILADDAARNEFTNARPVERTVVEALAAGCDAVVLLDANPQRIRLVRDAIENAVRTGELTREALDRSKERLSRWQELLKMSPTTNPGAQARNQQREPPPIARREVIGAAPEKRAADPIAPAAKPPAPAPKEEPISVAQVEEVVSTPPEPAESAPEQEPDAGTEDEPRISVEPEAQVETDPVPVEQTGRETAPDAGAEDDETTLGVRKEPPAEDAPEPETSVDEVALNEEGPDAETRRDASDLAEETLVAPIEEESSETTVASEDVEPGSDPSSDGANTAAQEAPETAAALEDIEPEPEPSPDNASTVEAVSDADAPSLEEAVPDETVSTPPVEEQEPETFVVARASTESGEGASQSGSIEHTVRENELLSEIASLYGVSPADLVRWNDLQQAKLDAGSTLTIRLEPERPVGEEFDFKVPSEEQEGASMPDLSALTDKILHTVASGDTLPELAKRYKVSVEDLTLWNGLEDGAIQEGQKLTIFLDSEPEAADSADEVKTVEYEVQAGDTLLKIALKFATTRDVLLEINEIEDPNHIFVGQKLKVPAGN